MRKTPSTPQIWDSVVSHLLDLPLFRAQRGRLLLKAALAGTAAVSPACHVTVQVDANTAAEIMQEKEHKEEQARRKADPNGEIEADFQQDLDPGEVPADLKEIVSQMPPLYYNCTAEAGLDKVSTSRVLEMAKLALKEIRTQKKLNDERQYIVSKLADASQLGSDAQQTTKGIYSDNRKVSQALAIHWPELENLAEGIVAEVSRLVDLEAKAAQASGKSAKPQPPAEHPEESVPTIDREADLVLEQRRRFMDYSALELWMQPHPYVCDDVGRDEDTEGSSLMQPESVKALIRIIRLHRDAAIKRKKFYTALQAYTGLKGKKAVDVSRYDLSTQNDEILAGWDALLRTDMESGKRGPLEELLRGSILVAKRESELGAEIGRCAPERAKPHGDISTETPKPVHRSRPASSKGPASISSSLQVPATQTAPDGDRVIEIDQSLSDELDALGQRIKDAGTKAWIYVFAALPLITPDSEKAEMEAVMDAYRDADDVRKQILEGKIINRIKFYLGQRPELIPIFKASLEKLDK